MSIAERRHRHNNDIMKDSWDEKMSTSKSDRVADQLPEYGSGYLQLPVILYFGFAVLCASAAQSPRQSLQIYGFTFDLSILTIELLFLSIFSHALNLLLCRRKQGSRKLSLKRHLALANAPLAYGYLRKGRMLLSASNVGMGLSLVPSIVLAFTGALSNTKVNRPGKTSIGLVSTGGLLVTWGKIYLNNWMFRGALFIVPGVICVSLTLVALEYVLARRYSFSDDQETPADMPYSSPEPLELLCYFAPLMCWMAIAAAYFLEWTFLQDFPTSTMYQKHRIDIIWLLITDAILMSVAWISTVCLIARSSALTASLIAPTVKLVDLFAEVALEGSEIANIKLAGSAMLSVGVLGYFASL